MAGLHREVKDGDVIRIWRIVLRVRRTAGRVWLTIEAPTWMRIFHKGKER